MELLCCENQSEMAVVSQPDHTLLEDARVIQHLLDTEMYFAQSGISYFETVQNEINPEMRKILTGWMSEVCEDQQCEDVVLPLATSILDRFLSLVRIEKCQLQLLGSVCLLLASKLRQCRALTGELLCYYTDHSITLDELINWELLVVSKLKWNISAVTANDFICPLLSRISKFQDSDKIKQHSFVFISLCSTEFEFSMYKPSLIAVASLCVAALGLGVKRNVVESMKSTMQELTGHSPDKVSLCIVQIEALFSSSLSSIHQMALGTTKRSGNHPATKATTGLQADDLVQPETPTDVQDVYF